ncbi:MAG: serine/threonine protein kinase, partial [Arenimonas sp.]|nr:serine/threonine protein kinase [Arenimonas sp.]
MQSEELSPEELSSLLGSYMPDIPGYRVIRRIGKGGMSYVYLGVQVSLDRQVAIKVMSPEALKDEKSKQRFEQEAHTIAKLEHPCIVGVHEVGRTPQGLLYYVLPYLARGHLGQRDFTRDETRIIEVLRALLSALEYAHTRGIVHRDVKAENVLFDNADRPLLTDFGIALTRTDSNRITTAGLAIGSGGYMAPEQARGEVVDGRADLYSVGVLAYELLNGRVPYQCSDPLGLALMHAQDPIPRLPVERRHWQAFIDRSMAKSPDNRFRNAQQMLGALNQIAQRERTVDLPNEPPAPLARPAASPILARSWLRPALFALAGTSLLAMFAVMFWSGAEKQPAAADFFTGRETASAEPVPDAPPTAMPATTPGLAPPAAAAPATPSAAAVAEDVAPAPSTLAQAVAPAPPVVAEAVPDAAANAAPTESKGSSFSKVKTGVTVTLLEFDPAQPGARELQAARRQIKKNRLSTPANDNAIDSLLAARHAGAPDSETFPLSDEVITGLGAALNVALKAGRDESAKKAYRRASKFALEGGRLKGEAWTKLRKALPAIFIARLEKSLSAADSRGLAQTKATAKVLEVDPRALEPAWSQAIPPPRPSKAPRSPGPATVLVSSGVAGSPG